ncbi:calmodulin-A-like [Actinia tenebrosa]|uniref:Calmodulin-A-like n=1 Tax=Actinia tenebrosa TaxID=6105 RepID=A0A6P8HPL9_ACTTE|nr:calmodulin-A-like [Actinia tenebrosa]
MDKIPEEQLQELREAFIMFDQDGSGFICSKELNSIMRALGMNPTEDELQDMINEVDFDGNGVLDFPEFVQLMQDQKKPDEEEEELVNAFHVFDADGKGYIEASELRELLKNMDDKITEKELRDLLRFTHLDEDRKISFLEFANLIDPFREEKTMETE